MMKQSFEMRGIPSWSRSFHSYFVVK